MGKKIVRDKKFSLKKFCWGNLRNLSGVAGGSVKRKALVIAHLVWARAALKVSLVSASAPKISERERKFTLIFELNMELELE